MKEEESSEEARAGENQLRATGAPRRIRITFFLSGCGELLPRGPQTSRKWDRLFRVGGNGR